MHHTDEENADARIEVRRENNHIVIEHTASGNHILVTKRQALAIIYFLRDLRDRIDVEDG